VHAGWLKQGQRTHKYFCRRLIRVMSRFLGAFAQSQNASIYFAFSVFPHVSARISLDEFSWKSVLVTFMKICREKKYIFLNRTKTSGCIREDSSALYISDSDIVSAKIRRQQCSFSMLEFSIFTVLLTFRHVYQEYKEMQFCFPVLTMVTWTRRNIKSHIYYLSYWH
jgi:hypothetical protein